MAEQKLQGEFRIRGVILGAAGREGIAVSSQRRRLNRKEHEEVVLEQGGNDGALAELETNRDGSASEALSEPLGPGPESSGLVLDDRTLSLADARHGKAHVVLLVGPI